MPLRFAGLILIVGWCHAGIAYGQAAAQPKASFITNVQVNVDTRIELDAVPVKSVGTLGSSGPDPVESIRALAEVAQGDAGAAPLRFFTNVSINVLTTIHLNGATLHARDKPATTPAAPAAPAKKKRTAQPNKVGSTGSVERFEPLDPPPATPDNQPISPAKSDEGSVALQLSRLTIGDTLDVQLQGKFANKQQAAETAAKLNQEKLKWTGRALMLPLILKNQPDTVQAIGKLLGGFQATADGDTLTISVSIPEEVTTAIKRAVTE